jgi:hypothetical protein
MEKRTHRCKNGIIRSGEFATTRIPILIFFVAYRGCSLRAVNVCRLVFMRTALTIQGHVLAGRGKRSLTCHSGKQTSFLRWCIAEIYV